MLQIKGNICAWEVVPARSQHSRYTIPHFLAFQSQENSRKICERERELREPVAVSNFTSLLLCQEPPCCAGSCYHGHWSG